jgi:hypothetical protein
MFRNTFIIFVFLFSVAFVFQPTVAFLAENEAINKQFEDFVASHMQDLSHLDTREVLYKTKDVFKRYAKYLREMGYTVEADDKFLDEKFNELYSSLQGVNITENDLKNIANAASLTLKDLFAFIGNNLNGGDKSFNKSVLEENFLNSFIDYVEGNKETSQVSTPTTGLAAPITIAFSIVRALVGGLAGGGALGALLAAAVLTAADLGVSAILMIIGAIVGGTVLGIIGLLLGAIIVAVLFGFIGFIIPIIVALIIAVIIGIIVFGIAYLLAAVLGSLAGFITDLAGIVDILNAAISAGLGVATAVIVFLALLIPAVIAGFILGVIGLGVGIPLGVFFGSLIGGLGGILVGGVVGGLGGTFVAQLPFLPIIVFVGLLAFVLGTAAYMALGPVIGSTNDYLTPMSKGAYSIYLKYKDMQDSKIINNIDNILKDVLSKAREIFGPRLYNTINALEIIVDTTDFTNTDEIKRALDESLEVLETVVY